MARGLAQAVSRAVLRSGRSRLRPIWSAAHDAIMLGVAAYVSRGQDGAATYARGSFGSRDPVYGVSDIDMAVVLPGEPQGTGRARNRARQRWKRLCRMIPRARRFVDLAVYEDAELTDSVTSSTLTAGRALHPGSKKLLDAAGLRVRPGLYGPLHDWRLLRGPDRRPAAPVRDAQDHRMAAWLELQFLWRCAFTLCLNPGEAHAPYMCVKLVADPARIWLWLVHGERVRGREEALERALRRMPEEEQALRRALELYRALPGSPTPPLAEMLPSLVRLSARLARLLAGGVEPAGATDVRVVWGDEHELAIPAQVCGPIRELVVREPRLLPLADWRARAWPLVPDEAIVAVPLDPGRPAAIAAAASAARAGANPALQADGLLILPATRGGILRAVQCPATDPVSFAVLEGRSSARFPSVLGWSARDSAERAVAEHRAWLGSGSEVAPTLTRWVGGQARSMAPKTRTLGRLLTAARAALFLDSIEEGEPELALTMAAVAGRLGSRSPGAKAVAEEAYGHYRECRLDERTSAPARTIFALRELVLELPAYAFDTPWTVSAGGRDGAFAQTDFRTAETVP